MTYRIWKIAKIALVLFFILPSAAFAWSAFCTNPGKTIAVAIPGQGMNMGTYDINVTSEAGVPTHVYYRVRWTGGPGVVPVPPPPPAPPANNPPGIGTAIWTPPYPVVPAGGMVPLWAGITAAPNAAPGAYTLEIDWYDENGNFLTSTDPTLILTPPIPIGYNTSWLVFTAISLMLAGGYLILRFRKRGKLA